MNVHSTPKLSRDQKIAIVRDYLRSNLTQAAYSRKHGVVLSQLGYWIKQYHTQWSRQDTLESNGRTIDMEPVAPRSLPTRTHQPAPDEPDWKRLYEDERAKVEALQKAILVLGHQL